MSKNCNEPGDGMCAICLRDLFQFGHRGMSHCDACLLVLRRYPGVDPATIANGRTERLPQERPSADPRWAADAACDGVPVELFEHRTLRNGVIPDEVRRTAELYCAQCPIIARCRAEADEHEYVGLWAGQWRRYSADGLYRYQARDLLPDLEAAA